MHGINGLSGVTVASKKGDWGESDNGVGVFGTSFTGIGAYGVGGSGTAIGVQALTFGTGAAFSGTSLGGRVADFTIAAGNNSNVINATTAGNGMLLNAVTSGAGANVNNTVRVQNANVSNTTFGNSSIYVERGTPSPFNNYLFTGVPTALSGLTDAGIGLQDSSSSVYAVAGLTNTGVGLVGYAVNAAGYGLQTVGRLQFNGQGAATNNIMGSLDAQGNATWRTPARSGSSR